jgi:hypothetical protein
MTNAILTKGSEVLNIPVDEHGQFHEYFYLWYWGSNSGPIP